MNKQAKIIEIVQKLSGKPLPSDPEESLFDSGVLDSFTLNELPSAIEQEFSIRIPDSDLTPRKFESIARITAYIESRS